MPLQEKQSPTNIYTNSQPPCFSLVLDVFLKTGNMNHVLLQANASSLTRSYVSGKDSVLYVVMIFEGIFNSCDMIPCGECVLLPPNIFEVQCT